MRDEHKASLRQAARCGRRRRRCCGIQALRLGAKTLSLPRRQCGAVLMSADDRRATPPRASATFDAHAIAEIHRAAATGIYDIRGFGAKRKLPHFDDLLFLGASISRYPLEGYRERCGTDVTLGSRYAKKPVTLQDPDHHRGHELRLALGQRQGSARTRRHDRRHLDHHRRRRHDGGGARAFEDAGLSGAALALRHGAGPVAQGRCDRDRGRAGRQARRRRHAAGAEDLQARRRHAHAARGHRPALALPPSGLDRPGRSRDQDPRVARDHRLGEADLRQGRRGAALLRHGARGEVRRRRGRARRHARRYGGDAGRVHRACRHPDARRDPSGRAGADRSRHAPQGAADRVGRHPQRRRCREGARARRRRGVDRHRGADRARRQRSAPRGRIPQARHHGGLLRRLARGPRSGRHHHAGSGAHEAARSGRGRAAACQLSRRC